MGAYYKKEEPPKAGLFVEEGAGSGRGVKPGSSIPLISGDGQWV
jgi:hypothetical protein